MCKGLLLSVLLPLSFISTLSAQTGSSFAVTGVVQDQTGARLPAAIVELVGDDGTTAQSTSTDPEGVFRFGQVPLGHYELRASFDGFNLASVSLQVGPRAPAPQRVTLGLASLTQEINVSNSPTEVAATASHNVDAISLDADMLASLPVFDNDFVATISQFLDGGALGSGGVTLVVNGMEVSALNVSASAMQQIRVNQDPYSAEYSRPGRGRVEILTKPGTQQYHGEGTVIFRDSAVNARNPFAAAKPAERRRIGDIFLGGPVGSGGKTSFVFSANDQILDQQALVYAVGPTGVIQDNLPRTNGEARISVSLTRQTNSANTISVRPTYQYEKDENRNVGGTTLASAATSFTHHEQQVTYTQQTVFSPTLLNQVQMLLGHEREPTVSASAARAIIVNGAFTGGGGQTDLLRTETHINLNESLAWTKGHHLLQAGIQLPDWSRRGFYDHTNFGGTYSFADLDAYAAGQPYALTQQSGNGDVAFLEKLIGVYIKDDWQAGTGLSLSFGLRYDWQNYLQDANNWAPRLSMAYALGGRTSSVVRAGVGVFTDRSGPMVIADVLQSQPGRLTRYVITDPAYPDPFASRPGSVAPLPSVVRLASDIQLPQTVQYSVGLDHQLRKGLTLSVTYTGARGHHLFRSRDVNAPAPPLYLVRPDDAFGAIRQVESTGRQITDSLQFVLRGGVAHWLTGQVQYSIGRAENDTNGLGSYPANDYDLASEWGPADFARRHRLNFIGRTGLRLFDLGIALTMNTGGPYDETLGLDLYNNGRGRARPVDATRNLLETSGFSSLDLRASRMVKIGHRNDTREIILGLDAFNVINRVNYGTFVGTVNSPLFRQPVTARPARQFQFSARLKF